jgi:nucleoside-diphosphate-sugar epimerase
LRGFSRLNVILCNSIRGQWLTNQFHFNVQDAKKDLLDPAIIGTTGVLKSLKKSAPTVKRVVITSSFASIVDGNKGNNIPDKTYSEADWNPITMEEATKSPVHGYRASKTLSEKAAWEFLEKEKPNFTLATICPPLVLGPIVHYLNSLSALNTSNQRILSLINGSYLKDGLPDTGTYLWVDVRDVALMHVKAMEEEQAGGKRFFTTAGYFTNKELASIVRKNFEEYKDKVPEGEGKGGWPEKGVYKYDNSRASGLLGKPWTGLEESVVDTVKSLKAVGA